MVELLRIKLLEKRALKFECNIIGWKVLEIVLSHRPHDIKLDLLWDDWIFGWETDVNPNRKITPLSLQQQGDTIMQLCYSAGAENSVSGQMIASHWLANVLFKHETLNLNTVFKQPQR